MKRSSAHILLWGLLLVTVMSCLEPFTFDTDNVKQAIIVDGILDNTPGPHQIKISNANKFGLKAFDGISSASVSIATGNQIYQLIEVEEGIYELPEGRLTGVQGESYQLNVILSDGTEIVSPVETMPAAYSLDSVKATFDKALVLQSNGAQIRRSVVKVTASTELPETEETIYLRYSMNETYSFPEVVCSPLHIVKTCYFNILSGSQEFALFNSDLITNRSIRDLQVGIKNQVPPAEFRSLHYFSVYQHSLTRDAYLYWERVQQLITQEGTVFDLPPAAVPGNLSSPNSEVEILGYFQVSAVDIKRDFINRGDYITFTGFQVPCSPFGDFIPACCQCLLIEEEPIPRPLWF